MMLRYMWTIWVQEVFEARDWDTLCNAQRMMRQVERLTNGQPSFYGIGRDPS
jgi:hypothetical protein